MSNNSGKSAALTIRQIWNRCVDRLKDRASWYCHIEGPSVFLAFGKLVVRWIIGVPLALTGVLVVIFTIPFADTLVSVFSICESASNSPCIDFSRYIGFTLLLTGTTLYVVASHGKKLELQTAVYNEEIDNLIRDITSHPIPEKLRAEIDAAIEELRFFKSTPSEVSSLRLIGLRKLHADNCESYWELKAFAESDLGDYVDYVGTSDHKYIFYRSTFDSLFREHDRALNTNTASNAEAGIFAELKTHVKELREEIQWEKYHSGQGEAIVKSVTHWSLVAITSFLLLGMTPLLHLPMLVTELTILHWGLLGMAGSIIYTASSIRAKETSELGFEDGIAELRKMLLGIMIGGISAIILYAAIRSGVFSGKILPKFDFSKLTESEKIAQNLLAIFWAVFAGYSAKLLHRLLGSSEKMIST